MVTPRAHDGSLGKVEGVWNLASPRNVHQFLAKMLAVSLSRTNTVGIHLQISQEMGGPQQVRRSLRTCLPIDGIIAPHL